MKSAEGREGEMPVAAAAQEVSAAGRRESTANLLAIRLVRNPAVTRHSVPPFHTRCACCLFVMELC